MAVAVDVFVMRDFSSQIWMLQCIRRLQRLSASDACSTLAIFHSSPMTRLTHTYDVHPLPSSWDLPSFPLAEFVFFVRISYLVSRSDFISFVCVHFVASEKDTPMAVDIYQNNHVNVNNFKKMLATNDPNRLAEALGKRQSASAQSYGSPGACVG